MSVGWLSNGPSQVVEKSAIARPVIDLTITVEFKDTLLEGEACWSEGRSFIQLVPSASSSFRKTFCAVRPKQEFIIISTSANNLNLNQPSWAPPDRSSFTHKRNN
ncbi:hypothetical protein pipiens_008653 [Culex pipiens pipiens]|uniref:Uncharacterized protein n=1 Tax=Culex pipiens pipiens TaxID=38569 RepID=A0ABD1DIN0_CULPP